MIEKTVLKDNDNFTTFVVEVGSTKYGTFCDIEVIQDDNTIMLDKADVERLKKILAIVEKAELKWFKETQESV